MIDIGLWESKLSVDRKFGDRIPVVSSERCLDFRKVISCCFFATRSEILNFLLESFKGASGLVLCDSEVCSSSVI